MSLAYRELFCLIFHRGWCNKKSWSVIDHQAIRILPYNSCICMSRDATTFSSFSSFSFKSSSNLKIGYAHRIRWYIMQLDVNYLIDLPLLYPKELFWFFALKYTGGFLKVETYPTVRFVPVFNNFISILNIVDDKISGWFIFGMSVCLCFRYYLTLVDLLKHFFR